MFKITRITFALPIPENKNTIDMDIEIVLIKLIKTMYSKLESAKERSRLKNDHKAMVQVKKAIIKNEYLMTSFFICSALIEKKQEIKSVSSNTNAKK